VMSRTDRVALGRFVMRTKEYLVAIRAREQALTLSTMRFHDEVRPTDGIAGAGGRTKKAEVDRAVKMIEAMTVDWEPTDYEDAYRKRLQAIVRKKQKGGEIKAPKADKKAAEPVPDLMAALEETLAKLEKGEPVLSG
jgi:DNA end-binding protein Ku